jgi:hypothetical protein
MAEEIKGTKCGQEQHTQNKGKRWMNKERYAWTDRKWEPIRHEGKTVQKQQTSDKTVKQGGITKMDEIKEWQGLAK